MVLILSSFSFSFFPLFLPSFFSLFMIFKVFYEELMFSQERLVEKNLPVSADAREGKFDSWVRKMPRVGSGIPLQVFLPENLYWAAETGKSLADYSPWATKSQTWPSNWACTCDALYVFRVVFVLQQNSAEGTEIPPQYTSCLHTHA